MEPKNDENVISDYIPDEVVFTRYLYPKTFVKQSLLMALLDHNYDECLYWAYELYFSGFEDETYTFLFQIYHDLYRYNHPKFIKYMEYIRGEWNKNTLQYWLVGSIIATLCFCNYRIDHFVETHFKTHCTYLAQPRKKTVIIRLSERDIQEYKINRHMNPPRNYLALSCKYGVRSNIMRLFISDVADVKNKLFNNWLFYASLSPLWQERLEDFNGFARIREEKVVFDDDDYEEAFYERWNLEPDEQPISVQKMLLGDWDSPQMSLKDFCEKYGAPLVMKKLKVKHH
jgi:hypothetical protein